MLTHGTLTRLITLALSLYIGPAALAVTVYQWTDAEGVMHFSDTPPAAQEATAFSETELLDFAGEETDPDAYSIVNQLEAMTAWRRQAEEDRRAEKQLQLEEERLALEQETAQPAPVAGEDIYYPGSYFYPAGLYSPYYNRYPKWPGYKHKVHDKRSSHYGPGPKDGLLTREHRSVANPRFSRE